MKYYCLNLDRARERRANMERRWMVERGFELEFFPAFDRRRIEAGEFPLPYDPAAARARSGRELSAGEIACATSHHLLLRAALASGQTEIVVMEDDILPAGHATPEAFSQVVKAARAAFPHVSVLLLHAPFTPVRVWETRDGIALLADPPLGFRCVWLNARAMGLLAGDLATLRQPADWLWTRRFAPMKTVAMPATPLCEHDGTDTYIGNDLRGGAPRPFAR